MKGNLHKMFNAVQSMPQENFDTPQGFIAGVHPDFDRKGNVFFRIVISDIKGNKKRHFVKNSKTYDAKEAEHKLHDCARKLGWKKVSWNENKKTA